MSLSSLPLDILLVVFRDLDVIDVVRVGMTCKDLYQATQDRHVWVDQLDRLRREDPVLKPATPPLTSLSAQELKSFVTGWIKLRLRWGHDQTNLGFATKGVVGIPRVCRLMLLPGGKSLLVIDGRGGLAIRRVELELGRVSLSVVANFESDKWLTPEPGQNKLLIATSPCPILVRAQRNNIQIIRIDHHNDTMSLETTFLLPEGSILLKADGQGRVIGLLVQRFFVPPRAIIIHLDHPGVTLTFDVPPPYSYLWSICVPTESLAVIYRPDNILVGKIPEFSGLPSGTSPMTATPIRVPNQFGDAGWLPVTHMTSETLYDPLSAKEFDLYYINKGNRSVVVAVTIPVDVIDDGPLPVLKQESTVVPDHLKAPDAFSPQKGLYFDKAWKDGGVHYLVMPLKNLASQGPRKALRMFVSRGEFKQASEANEMDVDEATGRVIIWGWDRKAQETKIFVGDLV